ncbi:MAG TPA: PEP-CTERM sorting domain-containing protein, partial [Pirellulales bacterium]
ANSHIFVSNDTTRFNVTTGSPTVGAGITAIVNVGSTLELAGSVSALSSATNRVNITTVATSKGVLVSGTNQRVGQIYGAGSVVVNSGSDLTADHIIQNALVIQGNAASPAVVTIDASDSSGNPLVSSVQSISPLSSSEVDVASPAVGGPIASTSVAGLAIIPAPTAANSQDVGVPEPSSLVMLAFAALSAKALVRTKRRPSSGIAPIRRRR